MKEKVAHEVSNKDHMDNTAHVFPCDKECAFGKKKNTP